MGHFVELSSDGAVKVVTAANLLLLLLLLLLAAAVVVVVVVITVLQGIYNCIPETNYVSRVLNVAALLWLQYRCIVHVMLFPMINILYFNISTFQSMCAVPSMAVFCGSLMIRFPGMLLRYSLNDFEVILVLLCCLWLVILCIFSYIPVLFL